jgi:hypothetical protein
MKKQLCSRLVVALAALTLTVASLPVAAQQNQIPTKVVVNAGGSAILTTAPPDGGQAQAYSLEFTIIAGFDDTNKPKGYVVFVFGKAFSKVWGAVPPNDAGYISGKITEITKDAQGFTHLKGTLTEVDFTDGKGVVFLIDDAFDIKVGGSLGPGELVLQWCELPAFPVKVIADGMFKVNPL